MTRNPPPIDLSAPPAIEVRGAHKHYGALHAVDGIDLRIARGEIFGLIGHNGAGKSTLFKMILGLTPATAGEIRVGGAAVQGRDFRAARRHLGYLPENVVLYDNLNGLETLRFFARLKGAPLTQCPALLERVGLANATRSRAACRPRHGARPAGCIAAGALMRRVAVVLWSAFLVAIVAEGLVFSMLDPLAVFPGERHAALPPLAVYTLGFFLFWLFGALAGMLSVCLLAQPSRTPPAAGPSHPQATGEIRR